MRVSLPINTINRACCIEDEEERNNFLWRALRKPDVDAQEAREAELEKEHEKRLAELEAEQRAAPTHYMDGRVRRKTSHRYRESVSAEHKRHAKALNELRDKLHHE